MKILICYGYASLNLGDSAISRGAYQLMRDVAPQCEIHLLSFAGNSSPYHMKTAQSYIEDFTLISRGKTEYRSKLMILISHMLGLPIKTAKKIIRTNNYDVVLMAGGHFLYDGKSWLKNDIRLVQVFAPLFAAKELKLKTAILGQSIGPSLCSRRCKKILSLPDIIMTRENESRKSVVRALPESSNNLSSQIDLAFFMTRPTLKRRQSKANTVGLNLRAIVASGAIKASPKTMEKQFRLAELIVKSHLQHNDTNVLLVSQVAGIGDSNYENDAVLHRDFKEKYFRDESRIEVVELGPSEHDAIKFYEENIDLLVSTRFHGLIFALLAGTPALALNCDGVGTKIKGLYKDLDLDDFVIDVSSGNHPEVGSYDAIQATYNAFPAAKVLSAKIEDMKRNMSKKVKEWIFKQ